MAETIIKDVKLKIGTEGQFKAKLSELEVGTLVGITDAINESDLDTTIVNKLSNSVDHIADTSNPHNVTKAQIGLDNVDNVKQYSSSNPNFGDITPTMDGTASVGTATTYSRSDHIHPTDTSRASISDMAAKYTKPDGGIPESDLTLEVQTSLNKADTALQSHQTITTGSSDGTIAVAGTDVSIKGLGDLAYKSSLSKSDIGLGNVDNTSDADKPISTKTQAALDEETNNRTEADADLQTQIDEIVEQGTGVTKFGGQTGEITVGKGLTMGADDAAKTVLVNGTGICYTTAGTSDAYTVTIPGITELYDGLVIKVRLHIKASTANCTLNVNDLGAVAMYYRYDVKSVNSFVKDSIQDLTYVSGEGWVCDFKYDSNYYDRAIGAALSLKVVADTPNNRIVFTTKNGELVPIYNGNGYQTSHSIDLTKPIYWYNKGSTTLAGAYTGTYSLFNYYYLALYYNNLTSTSQSWTKGDEIYAVFVSDGNGYFNLASDVTPITKTLPTEADATHYYCLVGIAANSTTFVLPINHPIYTFIDGTKQPFSGSYNDLTDKPSSYSLPVATSGILGGVKIGTGINVTSDGTISVADGSATVECVTKTFEATSSYWSTSNDTIDTTFGKYYIDITISNKYVLSVRVTSNYNIDSVTDVNYYPEVYCNNRKTSPTNLRIYFDTMIAGFVVIGLI